MNQNVTLYRIIKLFEEYQKSQQNIGLNGFGYGNLIDFGQNITGGTQTNYPFMFVTPQLINYNENITTYTMSIIFADRLNDDKANIVDVQSDMSIQAKRLMGWIRRGINNTPDLFDNMDITIPVAGIPFLERFNDYVGGIAIDAEIIVQESIDSCNYYPLQEGDLLYQNNNSMTTQDCEVVDYSSPSCPGQTIGQLPTFTGDVSNGFVVFNNSGNTETFKLNVNDIISQATSGVDVYSGGTLVVSQATELNFSGATITSGGTGIANIEIIVPAGNSSFGLSLNGAGGQISTGVKGYITIPYDATITGWQLVGTPSGNLIVDVWKDTFANFPPTSGDTITGSEIPTLSGSTTNEDLSLSTWTTSITSGDIFAFNVVSASTINQATLTIFITK